MGTSQFSKRLRLFVNLLLLLLFLHTSDNNGTNSSDEQKVGIRFGTDSVQLPQVKKEQKFEISNEVIQKDLDRSNIKSTALISSHPWKFKGEGREDPEIFNKLPLKSLACCKLTCKTWNSLISDSQFMHDTFKRVLGGNNYHLIFLESRTLKFYMRTFTYHHLINNNEAVIRQTHNPPSKLISQSILIGSCNGLVALLYDYRRYILWNPLTGNYSTMFGDRSHYLEDLEDLKVGLCYDAYSDEYTTVVAYDQFVEVVNFKDGTCSSNYSPNLLAEGVGKMVCGVPHWMNTKTSEKGIIYFDLKDKKFKGIEWPNRANTNELFGLAAMDGQRQLGIVLCHIPSSSLEIWVMEKYMDFESWTKLLIIPYQNSVASIGLSDMDVLGCMPTTEILINTRFEVLHRN
ncbi:F-box/kelch-repeat protein At3g23880-like [Beta vulgaris subsp. vulgaris]|uniref:F-box/kelch-repeat protein At3g23880-like n=1 Tax=Beta vulgaris subsp. vulgaris TaxID=3555 RepID=UPI0020371681|nr:F-box/kelch-repeat protein At3g23880-like [Beta vulgaris subsp. vulgaris]